MKQESIVPLVRSALVEHPPNPKYSLWSECSDGLIVGYCWKSIDSAWSEQIAPGWWYCVERMNLESSIHETEIQLLQREGN